MSSIRDRFSPAAHLVASVVRNTAALEKMGLKGHYAASCVGPDGRVKWEDEIFNATMDEGANYFLDTLLAGSAYTVTGPFMGLISSVSYSAISAADVGTQINGTNGWKEAGLGNAPTYTGNRPTLVFDAAAARSKALSAAEQFAISGSGTIKGAFVLLGTGALATKDNAAGKLVSAGLFSNGDKVVSNLDTVNVTWSLAL